MDRLPPILYHATPPENVQNILRHGLVPQDESAPPVDAIHTNRVFLSRFADPSYMNLPADKIGGAVLLAVDTSFIDPSRLYPDDSIYAAYFNDQLEDTEIGDMFPGHYRRWGSSGTTASFDDWMSDADNGPADDEIERLLAGRFGLTLWGSTETVELGEVGYEGRIPPEAISLHNQAASLHSAALRVAGERDIFSGDYLGRDEPMFLASDFSPKASGYGVEVGPNENGGVSTSVVGPDGEGVDDAYGDLHMGTAAEFHDSGEYFDPGDEPISDDGVVAVLTGMELPEEMRGLGLGRRMADELVGWAFSNGAEAVYTHAMGAPSDPDPMGFYEKLGFEEIGSSFMGTYMRLGNPSLRDAAREPGFLKKLRDAGALPSPSVVSTVLSSVAAGTLIHGVAGSTGTPGEDLSGKIQSILDNGLDPAYWAKPWSGSPGEGHPQAVYLSLAWETALNNPPPNYVFVEPALSKPLVLWSGDKGGNYTWGPALNKATGKSGVGLSSFLRAKGYDSVIAVRQDGTVGEVAYFGKKPLPAHLPESDHVAHTLGAVAEIMKRTAAVEDIYRGLKTVIEKYKGKGLFARFSDVPKIGIRPSTEHHDPYGVYFYPVDWLAENAGFGTTYINLPYITVAKVRRSGWLNLATVRPAKARELAEKGGVLEEYEARTEGKGLNQSKGGRAGKRLWDAVEAKVKPFESEANKMEWNRIFGRMGVKAIYDPGTGSVNSAEPSQIVVLDLSLIDVVDVVDNREDRKSVYHAVLKAVADEVLDEGWRVSGSHAEGGILADGMVSGQPVVLSVLPAKSGFEMEVALSYHDTSGKKRRIVSRGRMPNEWEDAPAAYLSEGHARSISRSLEEADIGPAGEQDAEDMLDAALRALTKLRLPDLTVEEADGGAKFWKNTGDGKIEGSLKVLPDGRRELELYAEDWLLFGGDDSVVIEIGPMRVSWEGDNPSSASTDMADELSRAVRELRVTDDGGKDKEKIDRGAAAEIVRMRTLSWMFPTDILAASGQKYERKTASGVEERCWGEAAQVLGAGGFSDLNGMCLEASVVLCERLRDEGVDAKLVRRWSDDHGGHWTVRTPAGEFDPTIAWWGDSVPEGAERGRLYEVADGSPHAGWKEDDTVDEATAYCIAKEELGVDDLEDLYDNALERDLARDARRVAMPYLHEPRCPHCGHVGPQDPKVEAWASLPSDYRDFLQQHYGDDKQEIARRLMWDRTVPTYCGGCGKVYLFEKHDADWEAGSRGDVPSILVSARRILAADGLAALGETIQWKEELYHGTSIEAAASIARGGFHVEQHGEMSCESVSLTRNPVAAEIFAGREGVLFEFDISLRLFVLPEFVYDAMGCYAGTGMCDEDAIHRIMENADALKRIDAIPESWDPGTGELPDWSEWRDSGMDEYGWLERSLPGYDGVVVPGFDSHHPRGEAEIAVFDSTARRLMGSVVSMSVGGKMYDTEGGDDDESRVDDGWKALEAIDPGEHNLDAALHTAAAVVGATGRAAPTKMRVYRAEGAGRGSMVDAMPGGTYFFPNREMAELWAGEHGEVVERTIDTSKASVQDVPEGEMERYDRHSDTLFDVIIRRSPDSTGEILEIVVFDDLLISGTSSGSLAPAVALARAATAVAGPDLAAVREFLEGKWAERGRPTPSESCIATASFLSKLLPGAEVRGGQPEGHRDLVRHGLATEDEARSGGGWRDDDGYLLPHLWVESGGMVYDLTADQFGGNPVTVAPAGGRYVPSELSDKNARALRAVDAETDAWLEEWESARTASSDWDSRYPAAGDRVDGRAVLAEVPNTGSISASFGDWEELPGIREVPMSDFGGPESVFYAADDFRQSRELASRIRESGEVSPLIIALDDDGPYILEGAHRFVALHELGAKSFPALVVIDKDVASTEHTSRAANSTEASFRFSELPAAVQADIAENLHDAFFAGTDVSHEVLREVLDDMDTPLPSVRLPVADLAAQAQTRNTSATAVANLVETLRRVGELDPILTNAGRFHDGGHRLMAYEAEGRDTIPTVDISPLLSADWEAEFNEEIPGLARQVVGQPRLVTMDELTRLAATAYYHGTTVEALRLIEKDGFIRAPVYMADTEAAALEFAQMASEAAPAGDTVVLKIMLPADVEKELQPDSDLVGVGGSLDNDVPVGNFYLDRDVPLEWVPWYPDPEDNPPGRLASVAWYYHGSTPDDILDVAQWGLLARADRDGVSVTSDPDKARAWAGLKSRGDDDIEVFRIPASAIPDLTPEDAAPAKPDVDFTVNARQIPPEDLQIMRDGEWVPLLDVYGEFLDPITAAQALSRAARALGEHLGDTVTAYRALALEHMEKIMREGFTGHHHQHGVYYTADRNRGAFYVRFFSRDRWGVMFEMEVDTSRSTADTNDTTEAQSEELFEEVRRAAGDMVETIRGNTEARLWDTEATGRLEEWLGGLTVSEGFYDNLPEQHSVWQLIADETRGTDAEMTIAEAREALPPGRYGELTVLDGRGVAGIDVGEMEGQAQAKSSAGVPPERLTAVWLPSGMLEATGEAIPAGAETMADHVDVIPYKFDMGSDPEFSAEIERQRDEARERCESDPPEGLAKDEEDAYYSGLEEVADALDSILGRWRAEGDSTMPGHIYEKLADGETVTPEDLDREERLVRYPLPEGRLRAVKVVRKALAVGKAEDEMAIERAARRAAVEVCMTDDDTVACALRCAAESISDWSEESDVDPESFVDEGFVADESGHEFWGSKGSGCLFVRNHTEEGQQLLLVKRSPQVEEPNTWGTTGGAVPKGESNLFASAVRETREEIGSIPSYKAVRQYVWKAPGGSFTYTTFILECTDMDWLPTAFNWEATDAQWVSLEEAVSYDLHFGLVSILKDLGESVFAAESVDE